MKYDPRPTLTSPSGASDKRVRVMIEPADPEAQAEVSIADIPGLNEIAHTEILPTKQLR
jgi:hypothetical protein